MKQFLSIIGGMCALVVCLILFALQVAFFTLISSREFFTGSKISEVIENIDLKVLIKDSDIEVDEELYNITSEYGITKEQTDKIIESDSLKSFASDFVSSTIDSIFNGAEEDPITADKINKLIDDLIIECDLTISQSDKIQIKNYVLENSEAIEKELSVVDSINSELDEEERTTIRFVFGSAINVIFIFALVVLFLIIMLFRWSFYKTLIWYGITTVLSSLTALTIGFGISEGLKYINTSEYENYYTIINSAVSVLQKTIIIYGIVGLIIGIIFIVGFVLIRNNKKKVDTVIPSQIENTQV